MTKEHTADFDEMLARRYLRMKSQAKSRGVEFNLPLSSLRNILKARKCYYTGMVIGTDQPENAPNQLTVDRKNPKIGYMKGNVVACSHLANSLKNSYEHLDNKGRQNIDNSDILRKLEKDIRALKKMHSAIKG